VLLHNIPYLDASLNVREGVLASTLHLSGETVLTPDTHVAYFVGDFPHRKTGEPIQQLRHQDAPFPLGPDVVADRSFSIKPPEGYANYYDKLSTYANIISGPAQSLSAEYTPKRFIPVKADESEAVFEYIDTASSRAGIAHLSEKLAAQKVAIVGLGGTGSYILDLLVKCPIREIHLFDGDKLLSHNAFRMPGCASLEELERQSFKVEYFERFYSKMRRGLFAHPIFISDDNLSVLEGSDFVFVTMDGGSTKKSLLSYLESEGIDYIDCGIGLEVVGDMIAGQVRTTTSLVGHREHVWLGAIPMSDEDVDNAYSRNIQIADLNALNAALAVIRWKRLRGFYLDLEQELQCIYPIDGNMIINDIRPNDLGSAK